MNELKTLKELSYCSYCTDFEVRQEAIKWIKSIKQTTIWINSVTAEKPIGAEIILTILDETGRDIYGTEWIKHFFNITDEDLK